MSTFELKCQSCGTLNRIPAQKQGVAGTCGNCHAKLPPLYFEPQPLTDAEFDAFVARYDGPVLAEFWAPW